MQVGTVEIAVPLRIPGVEFRSFQETLASLARTDTSRVEILAGGLEDERLLGEVLVLAAEERLRVAWK